jgi:hypothetical protein
MVMGGVSWRGGSQEVAKPMAITQFKMEDTYIFCNVIEVFLQKRMTQVERWRPSDLFKLQMILDNCVKTHWRVYVINQIFQFLNGGID